MFAARDDVETMLSVRQTLWRSNSRLKTKTTVDRHIKFLLPTATWKTMLVCSKWGGPCTRCKPVLTLTAL